MIAVILIFVVLPIVIVALVLNHRRYEIDKRTDVMLKAIECGVPTDSAVFRQMRAPALKRQKDKVRRSLITAIVFFALGILPFSFGLRGSIRVDHLDSSEKTELIEKAEQTDLLSGHGEDIIGLAKMIFLTLLTIGTLFLSIGAILLVVFFIRKKDYEDELAESDNVEYVK